MATVYSTIESNIEDMKVREKAGEDFMKIHNVFAEVAGRFLDDWNYEWNRKHPELIGRSMRPGSAEYNSYGDFLANKSNSILRKVNELVDESSVNVQCVNINGAVTNVGVLKSDPSKFVFMGK